MDDIHEKEFLSYLRQKAEEYGFVEPKKTQWINYMSDTSRGERIMQNILTHVNLSDSSRYRALDIGCGFGGLLSAMQKYYQEVSGIDNINERVEWSRKRVAGAHVECCDATKLPWPSNYFDLVVSTDVFEHISFKEQVIAAREMTRVLKPGGCAFVSVPNRFQLKDEHNYVWFGTWLPRILRGLYLRAVTSNKSVNCWFERTGKSWKRLFESQMVKVTMEASGFIFGKKFSTIIPPNRYNLFMHKLPGH
jgi:ubiquinone/menaquinone biosynthesis C-methylase UbiE